MLIRWAIQNGTSVIPKATGESHIKGNLEALDMELSKEEFEVSLFLTDVPCNLCFAVKHRCMLGHPPDGLAHVS